MENKAFEDFCRQNRTELKINEPMCNHTSFKIGGAADYFVNVKSETELCAVIKALKEYKIPYFILGKGSNILVSDKGIEGAVISLSLMNGIETEDTGITAMAGASLAGVCTAALENSLTGLEFAYGIPGSTGGALYMNAGAYGGEMSQAVESCRYITDNGEIKSIDTENMQLGYRKSVFSNGNMIITSVKFSLKKGNYEEIQSRMNDYLERRKTKQPLEFPSAGSTFKRPEGYFAGALIEKNQLKGRTAGGAKVSEKHAGFIINYNNATCEDVKELIGIVKQTVFEADGVTLEPEVIFVGKE